MTSSDLLRIVLRRWYLTVLGAALSVGLVYAATHEPPVYWTQFNMLLLQPRSETHTNYLSNPRYTLYPTAGVVVRDFNADDRAPLLASPDTSMVGQGLTRGVQVRLPNQGSQWRPVFQANFLDVQVVDASPEAVLDRAQAAQERVSRILRRRQDAAHVSPGMQVTSIASTADPVVYQVGGSRMRAAAATGLAGAAITTVVVYWTDRLLLVLRRRRTAASAA